MHTFLKIEDDRYDVGQYLMGREGYYFKVLFSVPSVAQAFNAVNSLNGGTRISVTSLHMKEPEL